jgi:DNA-binding MarR family transcriptional regulator
MSSKITVNEEYLWAALHNTSKLVSKCEDIAYSQAGLSTEKYKVLLSIKYHLLATKKPVILASLSTMQSIRITSLSAIIDRMEKEGLVKKVRDLPDRRSIHLIITPKAEGILNQAMRLNVKLVKKLFLIFSDSELNTLTVLIDRLRGKACEESGQEEPNKDEDVVKTSKFVSLLNDSSL